MYLYSYVPSTWLLQFLSANSSRRDSNPRPTHYECVALPAEPRKHSYHYRVWHSVWQVVISFTDEYYRSELVLITAKAVADQYNHPLSSEELASIANGQVFVSQTSTVTDEVIDIFKENYSAIHATPLKSFALAATDVSNGTAFAMTAELPVAQSIVASFSNLGIIHINQDILGEKQSELGVSIGIQKGNTELQSKINAALSKITIEERTEMMRQAVERSSSL